MKEVMRYILVVVGCLLGMICVLYTATGVFGRNYDGEQLKQERIENQAFKNYYDACETLLDSLNVNEDSPILETDAGSDYLSAKAHLDSVYNKNTMHRLNLQQRVVTRTTREKE